ncbi:hypothetical protein TD95_001676 [Thielaviopsis punctulata]|uniref:Uncharacterized protein n=1 Tax=Thielaviopsis punctulata TaxID=72032 RepID=A0A0F4ZHI0_9PEZI|nr:hypothetical protein TD95_001676 [Thielaviopsis punctulata]
MAVFQAPGLGLMEDLLQSYPCRPQQIETLATLLHPDAVLARNVVVYGPEATGKSTITEGVVSRIGGSTDDWTLRHAMINSVQCITSRHMFERSIALVQQALGIYAKVPNCENLAQFTIELTQVLGSWVAQAEVDGGPARRHFVLVFDDIDRQREAATTLAAGLARLPEIIPCLTCVFIVSVPPPAFLRTTAVLNVHFPNYAKHEFVKILATTPPAPIAEYSAAETNDLWTRFCGTVHDSLARAATRTLPLLRHSCERLWPLFIAPVKAGTLQPKEFSRLLIASRVHFADEALINPSLIAVQPPAITAPTPNRTAPTTPVPNGSDALISTPQRKDLAALLPTMPRLILLAAYLASHNPARHDLTVFSTFYHGKKKRRGGLASTLPQQSRQRSKHRKIARKLLGSHSFIMERMMAILATVRTEWAAAVGATAGQTAGMDGDIGVAMATLASLRLLVRVGMGSDLLDRGARWRITVNWDDVRSIGRSVGLEIEDWLVE